MKPRDDSKSSQARRERALFEAVASLRSADECQKFFRDLCTPAELQAMADRFRAAVLLDADVPYRTVYERTGVSVTTVGRVARTLREGEGGYAIAIARTQRDG
jgi:TrpR-related protein YerC/YecD